MKNLLTVIGITVLASFFWGFLYLMSQWPKTSPRVLIKEIALLPDSGDVLKTEVNQKRWRLYEAAKEGSEITVFRLLREGISGNIKDKIFGWTPLHWIVAHQNQPLVLALLKNGAEVNARDNNLWTPLHEAVSNSDLEIAALLLKQGANVNTEDINLWTPLHEAVSNSDLEIAALLLKQGANVNKKDKNHWSPLELAKKEGNRKALKLLSKYNITFKFKTLIFLFLLFVIGVLLVWPAKDNES